MTRIELGCPVRCTDGPFGELADVVIDPIDRRVAHLVVEPQHSHALARLVPVELATVESDGSSISISLSCTVEEVRRLAPVQEILYIRTDRVPLDDPDWDVGVEEVLAYPHYESPFDYGLHSYDPFAGDEAAIAYDRVPKGEVEIRRRSEVLAADGKKVGDVDGFVVDSGGNISHIVLERGHLWGHREVTIPIGAVQRVETDTVTLSLSKDEVGDLPSVPFHRRFG